MESTQHIFLTAGGTGGHVMPALALRQQLEQKGYQVTFFTDARGQNFVPEPERRNITVLPVERYQGGLARKLKFVLTLCSSLKTSWRILQKNHAHVVVGFGGYVTLPLLLAAILSNRTIILHEQNAILGRVNRLIGAFASKIALSTPTIYRCPFYLQSKIITTGLPVRSDIEALRLQWPLLKSIQKQKDKTHPLRILVLGGSQAAHIFSEIIPKTLACLPENLQKQIRVRHQCRTEDQVKTAKAYESLATNIELKAFFHDIPAELQWADLVIARAGASTIAELAIVGKAALFVPFPYAMDDHQRMNAQLAITMGGGWWQNQGSLEPQKLAYFLQYLLEYPQAIDFAAEEMRRYGCPLAATRLVNLITSFYSDKKTGKII